MSLLNDGIPSIAKGISSFAKSSAGQSTKRGLTGIAKRIPSAAAKTTGITGEKLTDAMIFTLAGGNPILAEFIKHMGVDSESFKKGGVATGKFTKNTFNKINRSKSATRFKKNIKNHVSNSMKKLMSRESDLLNEISQKDSLMEDLLRSENIKSFKKGGRIKATGLKFLHKDEFVVNPKAAKKNSQILKMMNKGGNALQQFFDSDVVSLMPKGKKELSKRGARSLAEIKRGSNLFGNLGFVFSTYVKRFVESFEFDFISNLSFKKQALQIQFEKNVQELEFENERRLRDPEFIGNTLQTGLVGRKVKKQVGFDRGFVGKLFFKDTEGDDTPIFDRKLSWEEMVLASLESHRLASRKFYKEIGSHKDKRAPLIGNIGGLLGGAGGIAAGVQGGGSALAGSMGLSGALGTGLATGGIGLAGMLGAGLLTKIIGDKFQKRNDVSRDRVEKNIGVREGLLQKVGIAKFNPDQTIIDRNLTVEELLLSSSEATRLELRRHHILVEEDITDATSRGIRKEKFEKSMFRKIISKGRGLAGAQVAGGIGALSLAAIMASSGAAFGLPLAALIGAGGTALAAGGIRAATGVGRFFKGIGPEMFKMGVTGKVGKAAAMGGVALGAGLPAALALISGGAIPLGAMLAGGGALAAGGSALSGIGKLLFSKRTDARLMDEDDRKKGVLDQKQYLESIGKEKATFDVNFYDIVTQRFPNQFEIMTSELTTIRMILDSTFGTGSDFVEQSDKLNKERKNKIDSDIFLGTGGLFQQQQKFGGRRGLKGEFLNLLDLLKNDITKADYLSGREVVKRRDKLFIDSKRAESESEAEAQLKQASDLRKFSTGSGKKTSTDKALESILDTPKHISTVHDKISEFARFKIPELSSKIMEVKKNAGDSALRAWINFFGPKKEKKSIIKNLFKGAKKQFDEVEDVVSENLLNDDLLLENIESGVSKIGGIFKNLFKRAIKTDTSITPSERKILDDQKHKDEIEKKKSGSARVLSDKEKMFADLEKRKEEEEKQTSSSITNLIKKLPIIRRISKRLAGMKSPDGTNSTLTTIGSLDPGTGELMTMSFGKIAFDPIVDAVKANTEILDKGINSIKKTYLKVIRDVLKDLADKFLKSDEGGDPPFKVTKGQLQKPFAIIPGGKLDPKIVAADGGVLDPRGFFFANSKEKFKKFGDGSVQIIPPGGIGNARYANGGVIGKGKINNFFPMSTVTPTNNGQLVKENLTHVDLLGMPKKALGGFLPMGGARAMGGEIPGYAAGAILAGLGRGAASAGKGGFNMAKIFGQGGFKGLFNAGKAKISDKFKNFKGKLKDKIKSKMPDTLSKKPIFDDGDKTTRKYKSSIFGQMAKDGTLSLTMDSIRPDMGGVMNAKGGIFSSILGALGTMAGLFAAFPKTMTSIFKKGFGMISKAVSGIKSFLGGVKDKALNLAKLAKDKALALAKLAKEKAATALKFAKDKAAAALELTKKAGTTTGKFIKGVGDKTGKFVKGVGDKASKVLKGGMDLAKGVGNVVSKIPGAAVVKGGFKVAGAVLSKVAVPLMVVSAGYDAYKIGSESVAQHQEIVKMRASFDDASAKAETAEKKFKKINPDLVRGKLIDNFIRSGKPNPKKMLMDFIGDTTDKMGLIKKRNQLGIITQRWSNRKLELSGVRDTAVWPWQGLDKFEKKELVKMEILSDGSESMIAALNMIIEKAPMKSTKGKLLPKTNKRPKLNILASKANDAISNMEVANVGKIDTKSRQPGKTINTLIDGATNSNRIARETTFASKQAGEAIVASANQATKMQNVNNRALTNLSSSVSNTKGGDVINTIINQAPNRVVLG